MEGERRGGVTGARSGRALMLPTERLPLSRRPEDHLADPGSGAGGDGAGACLGEEKQDAGSRFPSGAHRSGGPASSSSGAERAALRGRWRGGRDGRGDTPGAGDGRDPPGGGRPTRQQPLPPRRGRSVPRESRRRGRVRRWPFLQTRLGCRPPPSPGARNPPAAGKEPGSPGTLPPWTPGRQRAEQAGSGQRPSPGPPRAGSAAGPAGVSAREPASPGASNYCDMSNM